MLAGRGFAVPGRPGAGARHRLVFVDRLVATLVWSLVLRVCAVGVLISLVAGGVTAALPDVSANQWSDRCRRGFKAFVATMTLYIAFVLMVLAVRTALA